MSLVCLATAVLVEPLLLRRRQRSAIEVGVLREIVTCVASVARPDSAASPRPSSVSAKSSVGVFVLGSPFSVQRVKALGPAPPEPAVWTTVVLAKITQGRRRGCSASRW